MEEDERRRFFSKYDKMWENMKRGHPEEELEEPAAADILRNEEEKRPLSVAEQEEQ